MNKNTYIFSFYQGLSLISIGLLKEKLLVLYRNAIKSPLSYQIVLFENSDYRYISKSLKKTDCYPPR